MWQRPGDISGIRRSLVISVLESYEIVRGQCRYLETVLPEDWEFILLDDGSDPPIEMPEHKPRHFSLVYTRSSVAWTQAIARNLGARLARGQYVLFTDIDHIVTREALETVSRFEGSRMLFPRSFAVLDDVGRIHRDEAALGVFGWNPAQAGRLAREARIHPNTFAIRRDLFIDGLAGGYDEAMCSQGKYVEEDTEINTRYSRLVAAGCAEPDVLGPEIYVYPDPASNPRFHRLQRN
jgi:hypothetical protein